MSQEDRLGKVVFSRKMLKEYSDDFWKFKLAFYLDGTSFTYKKSSCDEAKAPRGMVWRKNSKGLKQGCLSRCSKAGYDRKFAHFFVTVSYGKGVVLYTV